MMGISDMIRSGGVDAEVENEYVFWCKVNTEIIHALITQVESYSFLDVFLKKNKDKTRFRVRKDGATWTRKVKNDEGGNLEYNHEIPGEVAMSMTKYSENIHRVCRCVIPMTKDGQPLLSASTQEPIMWEVDIFYTQGKGTNVSEWIKVELEVPSLGSSDISKLIPISYSEIIDGDTDDVVDKAHISNLWDNVLNIVI